MRGRAEPQIEVLGDGVRALKDRSPEPNEHERDARAGELAKKLKLLLTYGQAVRVGHASCSAAASRGAARSDWRGRAPRPPDRRRVCAPPPPRTDASRSGPP